MTSAAPSQCALVTRVMAPDAFVDSAPSSVCTSVCSVLNAVRETSNRAGDCRMVTSLGGSAVALSAGFGVIALTAQTPDIARVERPGLVTRASIIQQVLTEARRDGVFPFGAAVPHVDYLPVRALHQQLAKVTRFHSPRAFSYMFSPGFEPLRRQIAIRMRDAGVLVDPREVVVTHGCVDALQMSLRVLTRPGDLIAAESPTYYGLLQLADLLVDPNIDMMYGKFVAKGKKQAPGI